MTEKEEREKEFSIQSLFNKISLYSYIVQSYVCSRQVGSFFSRNSVHTRAHTREKRKEKVH